MIGENDKAVALAEMQYELQPYNIRLLESLIDIYSRSFILDKHEKAVQKLNELVPNQPDYQISLANSYLFTGKLDEGIDVLEKLLKDNPRNVAALLKMGELYLHMHD